VLSEREREEEGAEGYDKGGVSLCQGQTGQRRSSVEITRHSAIKSKSKIKIKIIFYLKTRHRLLLTCRQSERDDL
jgi:hypothetical protein